MLARLRHVSHVGCIGIGAVLGGEFVGEARPRAEGTTFNRLEPRRFDGEARGRMEESNERPRARKIQCLYMGDGGNWFDGCLLFSEGERCRGGRGRGLVDVYSPETGA